MNTLQGRYITYFPGFLLTYADFEIASVFDSWVFAMRPNPSDLLILYHTLGPITMPRRRHTDQSVFRAMQAQKTASF